MSMNIGTLAAAKAYANKAIHKAELDDIELDKSLTKSNFAADAKAVGDELKSRIKIEDVPVASVNGKTGKIQLTAADVGAIPVNAEIPSIQNGAEVNDFAGVENALSDNLAEANAYTDSQRIAYEEKESYTLSSSEPVSLPFSELIGLEVVDILPDRVLMSTPSAPPSQTGLLLKYDNFEISYGTYNQMLSKPCLLLGDYQRLSQWCPLFFYDENKYQALIYAFEEVTDTMNLGITFTKGWHAVNTTTFANEPFDLEKYPFLYDLSWIERGSEESSKEYIKGMFKLAEEITYTIKAENILEEGISAVVSPWDISSGKFANEIFTAALFSFWFYKDTHETHTTRSVIVTNRKIHTIDPKYLPEGGFGYIEGSKKEILPEQVTLVDQETIFPGLVLVDGKVYTVVVDGMEYKCEAKSTMFVGAVEIIALGNAEHIGIPSNGEPWVIMCYVSEQACVFVPTEAPDVEHTLAIYEGAETIHTIESKFLPDMGGGENGNAVLFTKQTLTDEQKAQARANLGIEQQSGALGGIPMVTLFTTPTLNSENLAELSSEENTSLNEAAATGCPFVVRFNMPMSDDSIMDANVLVAPSKAYGAYAYLGFIWTRYAFLMHDPTSDTWGFRIMDMSLM